MEKISLRAGGHNSQSLLLELLEMKAHIQGTAGLMEVSVYSHALLDGDFLISLLWDMDEPYHNGSPAGLSLVQALNKFGLINHSTWIKKD